MLTFVGFCRLIFFGGVTASAEGGISTATEARQGLQDRSIDRSAGLCVVVVFIVAMRTERGDVRRNFDSEAGLMPLSA